MTEPVNIDTRVVGWVYDGTLADRGWPDGDVRTLARLLLRPCTWCGASGSVFRAGSGVAIERLDGQHMARRRLHE